MGLLGGSSFSPLSLSPALWLKADAGAYTDAGTTLATDTQTVQQWNDQSGNSTNASQGNGSLRAAWIASGQNGLPVLRFDGTDDTMSATPSGATGYHAFFVAKNTRAGATTDYQLDWRNTGDGGTAVLANLFNDGTTQSNRSRNNANTVVTATVATGRGAWHIYEGSWDGASLSSVGDGTAGTPQSFSGATTVNQLGICAQAPAAGGAAYFQGDVGEIILYSSALSAGNAALVRAYLKARWNTP